MRRLDTARLNVLNAIHMSALITGKSYLKKFIRKVYQKSENF